MCVILKIGIVILNIIYSIIKIFPVQNKVVFLSRQSNQPNTDFLLLEKELLHQDKTIKIKMLCKKIPPGIFGKIKYSFHMLVQMYHIATSKVAVLDTYCIVISCLKHKKSLKVIQMWHALGSLKKFGYSTLDKNEGSTYKLAKALKMHKNYDYVLYSSEICKEAFKEAFNTKEEAMLRLPLPRVDLIKNTKYQTEITKKIEKKYPKLKNKKVILYAPTFRKNTDEKEKIEELIKTIDKEKYNLIIKTHPLIENIQIKEDHVVMDSTIPTIEFAMIADYIITDYSAICYEIALLNKPMYFWTYDYDKYVNGRDFYLDYQKEMPGFISKNLKEILKKINKNEYDNKKISSFCNKYIDNSNSSNTKKLARIVLKLMK